MKKDTAQLLEELKNCSDFKSFHHENEEVLGQEKISEYLQKIIEEKKLKKADIIRRAQMSEVYAYQIMDGRRSPDRSKILCLAFGMALTLDEVQKMLKATGYRPLYAKDPSDCILIYAFWKGLDIIETNAMLEEYGEEMIG